MSFTSTSHVQKVAHRGGSALAPENTLAAFHHATQFPLDAIELDVQMSRDGYAIVFHDETLEELTDGQGNILDLDLAYLQSLNAAAHFPGGWSRPERIPTLCDVLDLARAAHVRVFIEIKLSKRGETYGRYPGIAEAVTREVLTSSMREQVMIMSFDWEVLPIIKMLAPGIETGILVSEDVWNPRAVTAFVDLVSQAKALQCEWIHMDYELFTPEMPDFFHTNGLKLGIWTVNDEAGLLRLAQAGVDALTSDRPDLLAALAK